MSFGEHGRSTRKAWRTSANKRLSGEETQACKAQHQSWHPRGTERRLRDGHFWYAGDSIIISDEEGRIIDSNEQASLSFGYNREELLLLRVSDIVVMPEGDAAPWKRIAPWAKLTVETTCIRKDGAFFPAEVCLRHEVREDRSLFVAIIRDITLRRKAEDENRSLLASVQLKKERLARLIDSINDEVWFTDERLNFVLTNPAARRTFGLKNAEVELQYLLDNLEIFRADGTPRPDSEAPVMCALAGEVVTNLEEIVRVPSTGKVYYRQVSSSPVYDAEGGIMGTVSVVRDITEQKKTLEMLQQRAREVEEANAALRVLLKQREQDKSELERSVTDNINRLVMPHLDLLGGAAPSAEIKAHVEIIRAALNNIVSSFGTAVHIKLGCLSPKEIHIAHLVKEGRQDKEIAGLLNLSEPTVRAHRRNIRKKLDLTGRKVNLRTFLSQEND